VTDRAAECSDGKVFVRNDTVQRDAIRVLEGAFQDGFGYFESDEIMIAIRSVPVLRDLGYIEAELGANVSFGIVGVGDFTAELLPQFGEFQGNRPIDRGCPMLSAE